MSKTALVPIADGTEEIEAVVIIDVLVRAGVEVTVASVMPQKQVICSRGVELTADCLIIECTEEYDLIALPGGMPGAEHLRDSEILTSLLKKQAKIGKMYAAICAAPVVILQHHGLLEGKKATCHAAFAEDLKDPSAVDERVVTDGNCTTSRGPGSAMEFAVALVEELFNPAKADELVAAMHVV